MDREFLLTDNPYKEGADRIRSQSKQPFGKMLVFGFLVLTVGLGLQGYAGYLHARFYYYVVSATTGVRPGELAERIQLWVVMSAVASAISLTGIGLMVYSIWRRLSAVN